MTPWAAQLRASHPARKCALDIVKEKLLRIIDKLAPEPRSVLLDFIVSQHAAMCVSWDWTQENNSYCKSLEAWLSPARKLWENGPVNAHEPTRAVAMTSRERDQANQTAQYRRMMERAVKYDREQQQSPPQQKQRQGVLQ